jgi:N-acetylglutamate synthase-like GNAT family acetyltransferase
MDDVQVRPFEPQDTAGVIALILAIQREEFGIAITPDDQPDLRAIPDFYQKGQGAFLVAVDDGVIVGTAALKDIGNCQAALRKMFVAATHRGRDKGVAVLLLARLMEGAANAGVREIFLGTTDVFRAAHRFYEKNGFALIAPETLPESFPRMSVDTRFYHKRLD